MNGIDYNSPDYKRSRGAYMAQCTFEYFISLLVTDAFLAKLLSSIGISDALIGIISSFISLAFVIEVMSIFIIRTNISTKKLVLIFDTISQLFFCGIYFIPFLPVGQEVKTVLVILGIIIAYAGKYLIITICFKWANSYVSPEKRAEYSAVKEIISLVSGIIFTAVIGAIVDRYEGVGNLNGAFLFIACAMLIINVCNFVCLSMIKRESKEEQKANHEPFANIIKGTFGNKNYRNVVIMTIIWSCARYFTVGFLGIFKTKDLLISVFAVQMINMVANFARVIVSVPFGKYSDRKSFVKGFELAMVIAAAAFFVNVFTTKEHWYFIIVYTILFNVSMAGINQNTHNIIYSYVDSRYITQAMALKSSISGIFGFGASIVGGKVLTVIQENGNSLFGIHMFGQQFMSLISFVLIVCTIIFIKCTLEKQKVIKQ